MWLKKTNMFNVVQSCVSVVYEFLSPESALESIRVSDEIRLLPVNHKAKGKMVQVNIVIIHYYSLIIEVFFMV